MAKRAGGLYGGIQFASASSGVTEQASLVTQASAAAANPAPAIAIPVTQSATAQQPTPAQAHVEPSAVEHPTKTPSGISAAPFRVTLCSSVEYVNSISIFYPTLLLYAFATKPGLPH